MANKLGAKGRKTRVGVMVVVGQEDLFCDSVELPVLERSMVHLDLTGSPSQGERWLAFTKHAAVVSLYTGDHFQGSPLLPNMSEPR